MKLCTAFNLTAWGYSDCQADVNDGSFGGIMSKLLFRHLPEFYPVGSAYAHFPFMVPEKMKEYVDKQPDASIDDYTWTRPKRSEHTTLGTRASKVVDAPMIEVSPLPSVSYQRLNWNQ
jgi:linoleate 10R-lipoxygenase